VRRGERRKTQACNAGCSHGCHLLLLFLLLVAKYVSENNGCAMNVVLKQREEIFSTMDSSL